MEDVMLIPVILAGGTGSRLWPLSRKALPKQFIKLEDDLSLFQKTLLRVSDVDQIQPPIIIGNEEHRFLVIQQLEEIQSDCQCIWLEPVGKSTAPAVALAAFYSEAQGQKNDLLVLPADHLLTPEEAFVKGIHQAQQALNQEDLLTFGIQPTEPQTGFGYIKPKVSSHKTGAWHVECFVEKPDLKRAKMFFEQGGYYWNSGMFLFKAQTYLKVLEQHSPEIYTNTQLAFQEAQEDGPFMRPQETAFQKSPADSIDYAIMEKTTHAKMVPLTLNWSDVGSWTSFANIQEKDELQNVCHGDVVTLKSENNYLCASHRLLAAVGVHNLVVVETKDAILVLDKDHSQDIKTLVTLLQDQNRDEVVHARQVNRPWGSYESLDSGDRFQVKRIKVNVGGRLSLQLHHHRSEHWVVVNGTARVTRGDEVFLMSENQSTYIPTGVSHRLENVGKIPLEIIEVQSGAYLGEDDIVRLDDEYGRVISQTAPQNSQEMEEKTSETVD